MEASEKLMTTTAAAAAAQADFVGRMFYCWRATRKGAVA